jgi:hypothetical protein
VTVVVVSTKFLDGAWMVIIAIPVLILAVLRRAAALPGRRQATPGEGAGGAREP